MMTVDPVEAELLRQSMVKHFMKNGWPEDASMEVSDLVIHATNGAIEHMIRVAATASNKLINLQVIMIGMEILRQRCEEGIKVAQKEKAELDAIVALRNKL